VLVLVLVLVLVILLCVFDKPKNKMVGWIRLLTVILLIS
jgi:hypothetical protein